MWRAFPVILSFVLCLCVAHVFADDLSVPMAAPQIGKIEKGVNFPPQAGGVTWAAVTGTINAACGEGSSCTISSSLAVTSGFVIAYVGVAGPTAITGLTLCGTNMGSPVVTTNQGGITASIFAATGITGSGSCTATVTGTGGGFAAAIIGLGTLTGYTSTTATTTCTGVSSNTGSAGTVTCSSALTVPSSGIAIGGASFNVNNSSIPINMTTDTQQSSSAPLGGVMGHNTSAGSLTPQAGNSGTTFAGAAIVGATWH